MLKCCNICIDRRVLIDILLREMTKNYQGITFLHILLHTGLAFIYININLKGEKDRCKSICASNKT